MADSKITALTALTAADPVNDVFPVVDVSDTTMAASGTTKKISVNNILGASGTATLASATITGALTTQSTPVKLASQTASDCTVFIGPDIPTATRSGRIGFITSSSEKNWFIANNWNVNGGFEITQSTAAGGSTMSTNPTFRISNNSDFLFLDGAGGTRMTLNSTGLGIGASPTQKLSVNGAIDFKTYVAHMDNFAVYAHTSDGTTLASFSGYPITFRVANTERMRIDTSGNVGVGVTPTNAYSFSRALQIGQGGLIEGRTGDYTTFSLATNAYLSSAGDWTYSSNERANLYAQSNGAFTWASAAAGTGVATFTPAMTLDANGRLLIGKTASALSTVGLEEAAGGYIQATVTSDASLFCNRLATDGETIKFYRQTVQVGNISVTTTATAYNTSSDYRLKESVQPLVGGLTRVNALKPSVYNWKSDGSAGEGFLAHELAEVVPAAVTGEKDAVNADGSIKSQGIDMSRVVPILVAAIQELTAEVNALKNA